MKRLLLIVALLFLAAPGAPSARAQEAEEPASFEELYGSLLTNNLFVKDRRPPPPPRDEREEEPEEEEEAPPPPPPEKDWRLVGIVWEGGEFRAYMENAKERRIATFTPGQEIASGVVGDVYIDGLSYAGPEGVTWVAFGGDLTGEVTAAAPAKSRQEIEEGSATDRQLNVAEMMRQRRLREREREEAEQEERRDEWRRRRQEEGDGDRRRRDDDEDEQQQDDGQQQQDEDDDE